MSSQVETMAWAHEVPWHGLGNKVDGNVTIEAMLEAAGLNWTVEQRPCFTLIDEKYVPIERSALVRTTDKKILTLTGEDWKPFQNKEAMEFFRDYCAAGGATLETAGALRGGRIIWALARVAAGFTLNGRDHVKAYILLCWTHQVGTANTARITSIRVVCANTLAMAGGVKGKGAEYRQSHIRPFDISAAKETIQLARDNIAQMKLDATALQALKMSDFDTLRFLATFFQPEVEEDKLKGDARIQAMLGDTGLHNKKLQDVLWAVDKAPGAQPGNGWGVLNGVTYWADHIVGRERDARMFNSWLGNVGRQKDAVHNALLEMVD